MGAPPPGLERAARLQQASAASTEAARKVLSWLASNLVHRGWLSSIDKLSGQIHEQTELPVDVVQQAVAELTASGLLELDGDRIATVAGLFATRSTGIDFALADGHTVHLIDPLAALAASVALQTSGEVRAQCPISGQRLVLECDSSGVASRAPETVCAFLGGLRDGLPVAGALLADDDALGAWQEQAGDPPGTPLTSFLFPMAAGDLGQEFGRALEPSLSLLPDFA